MTQRAFLLPGLFLAAACAGAGLALARLPGLSHVGPLTLALLLGLAWRAVRGLAPSQLPGAAFAAKTLLRFGIVLLGVRLNLDLVLHAGPRILLLDATVILFGLFGITWLGRRLGLEPTLACLIAVDSSICGASAVAATAPSLRARDHETALVIPLCSLIGTAAMLVYAGWQQAWELPPQTYGIFAGATLHEVAQVMAAVHPVPAAVEIGAMTKLTRVVLLIPVVFVLRSWPARRRAAAGADTGAGAPPRPWFVLGFLLCGVINTLLFRLFPGHAETLHAVDDVGLSIANVAIALAMAGMGLLVDFSQLRANGLRTLATALLGWLALATLAAVEISVLDL